MPIRSGVVLGLLIVGLSCASQVQRPKVLVYGAASLTDVLTALEEAFEAAHPEVDLALNLAATSTLARQIEAGAPADLFFSAHPGWMDHLAAKDQVTDTLAFMGNRLVVVQRSKTAPLNTPADLLTIERLALADPSHVPAGQYARQALSCSGQWDRLMPRILPVLDVRAALLTVQSGAADAAVVYATDTLQLKGAQLAFVWPSGCMPTVTYTAGRVRNGAETQWASRFLAFATHPDQQHVWQQFGFASLGQSISGSEQASSPQSL